jgi:hypothetical protein
MAPGTKLPVVGGVVCLLLAALLGYRLVDGMQRTVARSTVIPSGSEVTVNVHSGDQIFVFQRTAEGEKATASPSCEVRHVETGNRPELTPGRRLALHVHGRDYTPVLAVRPMFSGPHTVRCQAPAGVTLTVGPQMSRSLAQNGSGMIFWILLLGVGGCMCLVAARRAARRAERGYRPPPQVALPVASR